MEITVNIKENTARSKMKILAVGRVIKPIAGLNLSSINNVTTKIEKTVAQLQTMNLKIL